MSIPLKKRFKTFLYGTLPYTYYRIFHPESDKIECYKFIITNNDYRSTFLSDFIYKYNDVKIDVYTDTTKKLKYVWRNGKRLYFPDSYTNERVKDLYKSLIIEQDIRSPHHYVDSIEEFRGKTLLDIGGAEGMISLDAIEVVDHIYLFECDTEWVDALKATFEPWADKITIIMKYISNRNDNITQTLDDFLKDKPKENLFLKMDIEGEERFALEGGSKLFDEAKDLDFAICTYHKKDDVDVISSFLNKYHCNYKLREGYLYKRHKMRPCLIRGSKTEK